MPKQARTTRRLEVWLKDTDLALFVLNAQRRLVFFNRGSERLTGWSAPDLLGQKCDYVSEADTNTSSALLAALAPPPEAWTGKLEQAPVQIPRRSDSPLPRIVYYFPLVDSEQAVQAMLGVIATMPQSAGSPHTNASQRLHAELAVLRQTVRKRYGSGNLIGRSAAMKRAFEQIKLAQMSKAPVLFLGEMGTGKQHLARAMHYQGPFGKKAFVPLDCRTSGVELEETLSKVRSDQQADALQAGAVFFQNIDASPADFQRDLVDWLEQDAGSGSVRVLASSNRPLEPLVESDQFSPELYFALTSVVVSLPPLRERMEDLEPLAQHFLEELNRDAAQQQGGLSEEIWRQFRRYNWPGNVAELRQVILEARSASTDATLKVEHLPFRFRTGVTAQSIQPSRSPIAPLDQVLEQVERQQIERALQECRDNKARAAELLGITRPRLYRRMQILGIADADSAEEST